MSGAAFEPGLTKIAKNNPQTRKIRVVFENLSF